jgi:hypothetical protein
MERAYTTNELLSRDFNNDNNTGHPVSGSVCLVFEFSSDKDISQESSMDKKRR